MKLRTNLIVAGLTLAYATAALGAVSAEEAKKLGATLTAIGAEKGGNADGSIPPYTGGLTTAPASYKAGSGVRPSPYADEKPLFSITAKNMDQYASKLTEGSKALLKKYPTYRMDVYKTHRTVALPKHVLDATIKNAVTAQTANGGLSVRNAKGGIPFPIPKDGYEAMWNHLLAYKGEAYEIRYKYYNVDAAARRTLATEGIVIQEYPYYFRDNPSKETYLMVNVNYLAPARRAGESMMLKDPLNMAEAGRRAWQYLPGQRRVKLAPDVAFDTPDPGAAGMTTYDDNFLYNGSMERYTMKLIGKKEVYVQYNSYKTNYLAKADELTMPKHVNPDCVRWELHRVWVVEATLKPGKRHIYAKRTFYLDEDSWLGLATESYDARGQLFRTQFAGLTHGYDVMAPYNELMISYDLIAGVYKFGTEAEGGYIRYNKPRPASFWNPENMAGSGVR